ncbi:hypothetical protein HanRHA438_Chr06g0266711 [Helianthus annuus]|nr:hypothetical protein HanRHA438_Chr06g0266711 [Helianthus annuus]
MGAVRGVADAHWGRCRRGNPTDAIVFYLRESASTPKWSRRRRRDYLSSPTPHYDVDLLFL